MKKWREILNEDTVNKLFCVILAIAIFVFHYVSTFDKKNLSLPLEVSSEGLLLPVTRLPENIKITVRAKKEALPLISAENIKARLNFDYQTEDGEYSLPVTVSLSDELLRENSLEMRVKPPCVHVKLERKISRYVPIDVSLFGEVKRGYSVVSTALSTSAVRIVGPRSLVSALRGVATTRVNVSGAANSFSADVKLLSPTSLVKMYADENYRAEVKISPIIEQKSFSVALAFVNLDDSLKIKEENLVVSGILEGEFLDIEDYKLPKDSFFLDFSEIKKPEEAELEVKWNIKASLKVKEIFPKKFKVTILKNDVERQELQPADVEEKLENDESYKEENHDESEAAENVAYLREGL